MTDGKLERPEIRQYLTQLFTDLRTNLESVRGNIADEDVDNSFMVECISEMVQCATDSLAKVKHDVRLKDALTCQECFQDFNRSIDGYLNRFCSDECEERYNEEVNEALAEREDDCS